jgi:hypothetical protein
MSELITPQVKLSPEQQALCNRTLRFLHSLSPEIEKVAACGVDCSGYEALRQKLIEVNEAIHKNFCDTPHLPV